MELPTIKQTIFILATAYVTKKLLRTLMKLAKGGEKVVKIHEKNWKKDVVYLYQPPRAPHMPNMSPFCLKLETWLRANSITYEVRPSWTKLSSKGQIPFIELNGEHFADSQLIINMLSRKYNKVEMDLNQSQMGISRAVDRMIEGSLVNAIHSFKFLDNLPALISGETTGVRWMPKFLTDVIAYMFMKPSLEQKMLTLGIGRLTREERLNQFRLDMQAIVDVMGTNKFILGDEPHTVDITLFGHFAAFYYLPFDLVLKKLVREEFVILVDHMERMKERYWADWKDHLAP